MDIKPYISKKNFVFYSYCSLSCYLNLYTIRISQKEYLVIWVSKIGSDNISLIYKTIEHFCFKVITYNNICKDFFSH